MKRKFISALLFGATILASTSTFVSCKDYDDDITELRSQITSNATDLTSLVEEKAGNLEASVAALKEQQEALDAAYKLADQALQDAIAEAKDYAGIQAEEARVAAVKAAQELVDQAVADLQGKIDAANTAIEANKNGIADNKLQIAALVEADAELQKGISAAQAKADEAYSLANSAKEMAQQNAKDIADLNTKLNTISEGLASAKTELDGQISILNGQVADLLKKAEAQETSITSLEKQLTSLKESNDAALAALGNKDAELQKLIEDNNTAITSRLEGEVATLRSEAAANLTEAKAYTDALSASVTSQISGVNASIEALEKAYKAADEQIQKDIKALKESLEKQISDLQTAQAKTDKDQTDRIGKLETTLAALENGNVEKFAEKVNTMEQNITTLQSDVRTINTNLALETKRLKGLVFAPTTYVDGIECIKFATLQYRDWGNSAAAWEADAAKTSNKIYNIDDAQHTEQYLVNPKNAKLSDIVSLEFVSNQATNTRAVSAQAPIAVTEMPTQIVNGVMTLKLKKTTSESFGTNRDKFTIVALKATLSDDLLTQEEKDKGEKAEVYSDWARLYETSSTPYIHNTLAGVSASGKLNETAYRDIVIPGTNGSAATTESEEYAHFWNYSTAYNNGGKTSELPRDYNYRHIAKTVYYEDALDLYSLVEVCDKSGNLYDPASYGLGFSFDVMDYKLDNDNNATDATNQKNFAKLTDGHILTSTARDGVTEKNRDAIGKEPMIQVVLKDTSDLNNIKVVDVRYFKIQWVDKDVIDEYGSIGSFETNYVCGGDVSQRVLEETVNAIYTHYNMTRSEFHNAYDLNSTLFSSLAAAKAGTPSTAALGTITDEADWADPGQTHNLKWTINTTDNAATQAEYDAKTKTITAYGYFQSKTNPNSRIVFSLTLKLNIPQMGYADGMGKDQTMWKNGTRTVNPQLYSDATYGDTNYKTTMILGSLLKGYIYNGKTPATIMDLVNTYTEEANFVFDSSKLAALATATGTKATDWSIADNGLTLKYKGEVAATIDANGNIQLKESDNGSATSVPTAGAKLLVGQYAPVKLAGSWCKFEDDIDAYNVNFLTPLKITTKYSEVSVTDITSGGSSSAALAGTIEIKEAFVSNPKVVWNNASSQTKDDRRIAWYGVKTPVYDVDNAKTNIQKNGSIGSECNVKLSDIQNADGSVKYKVTVTNPATGSAKVNFHNLSGNAIGQEFKIQIPVYIETKWQTFEATLVVVVKPNI